MASARRRRAATEFVGNDLTGAFDVEIVEEGDEVQPDSERTFLSMCRDGGNFRVLEVTVDLDLGVVLSQTMHEPTLREIAEDAFRVLCVRKIWEKTD